MNNNEYGLINDENEVTPGEDESGSITDPGVPSTPLEPARPTFPITPPPPPGRPPFPPPPPPVRPPFPPPPPGPPCPPPQNWGPWPGTIQPPPPPEAPYWKGVRQYIGARYVPKVASPIQWKKGKAYENLEMITYGNAAYISKRPVPPNIEPPNDTYWAYLPNMNPQLDGIKERLDDLDEEIAEIKTVIGAGGEESNEILIRVSKNEQDILELKTKDADLNSMIAQLDAREASDIAQVEAKITSGDTALDARITSEKANLETKIAQGDAALETKITSGDAALTTKVNTLETELNGRITANTNAIEANDEDIADLREKVTANKTDLTTLSGKHTTDITSLQAQIAVNKAAIDGTVGDIDQINDTLNNQGAAQVTLTNQVNKTTSDIAAIDTRVTKLETDAIVEKADIQQLKTNVATLENSDEQQDTEIASLKTANSTITATVNTAKNDINALQSDMTQAGLDIDTLQAEMITAQNNIATQRTNIQKNQQDIAGLKSRMSTAESDIGGLQTDTAGLDTRLTTLENATGAGGGNALVSRVSALEQETLEQGNDITNLQGTVETHTQEIEDLSQRSERLQTGLDNLGQNVTALETKSMNLEVGLRDTVSKTAANQTNISNLQTEQQELTLDVNKGKKFLWPEEQNALIIYPLNGIETLIVNGFKKVWKGTVTTLKTIGATIAAGAKNAIESVNDTVLKKDNTTAVILVYAREDVAQFTNASEQLTKITDILTVIKNRLPHAYTYILNGALVTKNGVIDYAVNFKNLMNFGATIVSEAPCCMPSMIPYKLLLKSLTADYGLTDLGWTVSGTMMANYIHSGIDLYTRQRLEITCTKMFESDTLGGKVFMKAINGEYYFDINNISLKREINSYNGGGIPICTFRNDEYFTQIQAMEGYAIAVIKNGTVYNTVMAKVKIDMLEMSVVLLYKGNIQQIEINAKNMKTINQFYMQ